jgi:hypothetical protein
MKDIKILLYNLRKINNLICSSGKCGLLFIALTFSAFFGEGQNILPTPQVFNLKEELYSNASSKEGEEHLLKDLIITIK